VTRIAFAGLGIMGLPMATNLVTSGYDVHAYNRTKRVPFTRGWRNGYVAWSGQW
jgi:3-hydroxyisobutyrate dehydrogenase-like beta-hydroxyacid dehydrogenase